MNGKCKHVVQVSIIKAEIIKRKYFNYYNNPGKGRLLIIEGNNIIKKWQLPPNQSPKLQPSAAHYAAIPSPTTNNRFSQLMARSSKK